MELLELYAKLNASIIEVILTGELNGLRRRCDKKDFKREPRTYLSLRMA